MTADPEKIKAALDANTIERLWREAGLPEHFLGNGGSNFGLYVFARNCGKRALADYMTAQLTTATESRE